MRTTQPHFRAGDSVEVRSEIEIRQTLDAHGTLDGLPFMPEMLPLCGKQLRVLYTLEKTCIDIPDAAAAMRRFKRSDVVLLDGIRCSGIDHGGCQRGCSVFWRNAWLRRTDAEAPSHGISPMGTSPTPLRTIQDDGRYFCQSTEILAVTRPLARWEIVVTCARDVRAGNRTFFEMIGLMIIPLWKKFRRYHLRGEEWGRRSETPVESLGLEVGEWVEVKSRREILDTLDLKGYNRGLKFSDTLWPFCGKRFRVSGLVQRIILEGTGRAVNLQNTVTLEGLHCVCSGVAFGGCPRGESVWWREIWLKRIPGPYGETGPRSLIGQR
jgi:hypothetical protein